MKKLILLTMAALMSAMSFAQESNDNVMKIYTSDGIMTPIASKEIKDITFEEITPLSMDIEISNVEQNSMDIDFPMPEGCKTGFCALRKRNLPERTRKYAWLSRQSITTSSTRLNSYASQILMPAPPITSML